MRPYHVIQCNFHELAKSNIISPRAPNYIVVFQWWWSRFRSSDLNTILKNPTMWQCAFSLPFFALVLFQTFILPYKWEYRLCTFSLSASIFRIKCAKCPLPLSSILAPTNLTSPRCPKHTRHLLIPMLNYSPSRWRQESELEGTTNATSWKS